MSKENRILFLSLSLLLISGLPSGQNARAQNSSGQVIKEEDGGIFMEEVPEKKPVQKPRPLPKIDYSSLGVPVDPKGRIVPIIEPEAGPVLRNTSKLEMEYTPTQVYVPYVSPFLPGYGAQNGPGTFYNNPLYNFYPVPLGFPSYYSASSDDPQPLSFGVSGQYLNYPYGYYPNSGLMPIYPSGGYPSWGGLPPFSPWSRSSPFNTVNPFGGSPFNAPFNYPSYGPVYPGGFAGVPTTPWSPRWRGPFGGPLGATNFYLPQITQFQQQATVTPLFPKSLDTSDD